MRAGSPAVSVVMPVYNNERFVAEAIESVLNQTLSDFDFLIIDDASTDRTSFIINEYAGKDGRIRIIHNGENLGFTKSLNTGLKETGGEYIARMDGDDICAPHRLQKQVAYMRGHPECDFLAATAVIISEKGTSIKKTKVECRSEDTKSHLLNFGSPFVHSSIMMRKKAIDKLGGYNEQWPTKQDYELWLRAAFAGMRFACLSEPLVSLRFSQDSLSFSGHRDNALRSLLLRMYFRAKDKGIELTYDTIQERLSQSGLPERYAERMEYRTVLKKNVCKLKSLQFDGLFGNLMELALLRLFRRRAVSSEEVNAELDRLIACMDSNRGAGRHIVRGEYGHAHESK